MNDTQPLFPGALYYPYIHIHNVNWLRANLLIFPVVKRMLPQNYMPFEEQIAPFARAFGSKQALLQPANLWSERPKKAQRVLAAKLMRDSDDETFLRRFGKAGTRADLGTGHLGFQIHARKLSDELKTALTNEKIPEDKRLAWAPVNREWYDTEEGYIEVNPRLGEAVMSTLAIASAQPDGLAIVGDARSGPLHQCLLEKNLDAVYDAWLGPPSNMPAPKSPTGEKLMEFILGMRGDLSKLSVEALHDIASQREPIDRLIRALRERAAEIPPMDEGEQLDQKFQDAANDIFKKWEQDRANFRGFAKAFFGKETLKQTADFVGKIASTTLSGAAGATLAGGWYGSLVAGGLIGGGAGLVVGLVTHAGLTGYNVRQREKNSPYKVLTTLEDNGVVFQAEAVAEN